MVRNLFGGSGEVEVFDVSKMGLDRCTFIQCAMLVGCDYTPGLKGVGFRKALEILEAFRSKDQDPSADLLSAVLAPLRAFATWFREKHSLAHKSLRNKLGAVELADAFPEENVARLFAAPVMLGEYPSCGELDVAGVRAFAEKYFGWGGEKLATKIKALQRAQEESDDGDEHNEDGKRTVQRRSSDASKKHPRLEDDDDEF